ncbi:MAG: cadherin-like domain-containing protein [bacterium]|nr:cadherin-like domain-containing protein [bacterium]
MADIITNFFLTPVANRIAGTQTKKLAPSLLELGSDHLTRNPQAEAVARLFSPASSAALIARLDSFLTAQAQQDSSASVKNNLKSTTGLRSANDATTVQTPDVFARRETGAALRLKELLNPSLASSAASSAPSSSGEAASLPAVPAITRNAGLRVDEGGSFVLNSSRLRAGDADTKPQDIVFTLDDDGPRHGQLELVSKPGEAVTSFTQRDLDIGRVRYVSDGSESTTDSFKFTVSDGTSARSGSFAISISPVNDTPEASVNTGLTVDEGGSAAITTDALSARDPDGFAATTVFEVASGPAYGSLEIDGSSVTSFTQADLQEGRVTYVNDGGENTADSFTFSIGDGAATSAITTFNIGITPVNDAPTIVNNGATVAEGGSRVITTANLRATDPDSASSSLVYTVTTAPTNGRLENTANAGVAITSFTQDDLAAGRVRFVHNGAEASTAGFGFSLSDGQATLGNNTFNLNVTPVNDAPVQVTNTGAAVNRRSSTIITSSQLRATDVDSANLTYNISRAPARGRLELTTNAGVSITSFSQGDLDAGRVRYVHTSTRNTDDTFRFRLSDGTAQLAQKTFTIDVR